MLAQTTSVVDALLNPVPTGAKRLAAWENAGGPVVPALDTRALRIKYSPERAYAPRLIEGTFKLPLGTRWSTYERHRNQCVARFVEGLAKQGFDVCRDREIKVVPGMYPAVDPTTGVPILDHREFIVRAWFRKRDPETVRIELPPHVLVPIDTRAA